MRDRRETQQGQIRPNETGEAKPFNQLKKITKIKQKRKRRKFKKIH